MLALRDHDLEDVEEDQYNKNDKDESSHQIKIKDSGYAWVIVAAMFGCNMLIGGYLKSFGLISAGVLRVYPHSSKTVAGLMLGLLSGCRSLLTPLFGALGNIIGIRMTMYIGAVMYCVALGSSIFCTSVATLAFTLGAMVGLSCGLMETSQIVVVSNFFDSKVSMANGIRVAGIPAAGLLYPMATAFILENYGLQSLFLCLTLISAHLFIFITLLRPIDVHIKIKASSYIREPSMKKATAYVPMLLPDKNVIRPYGCSVEEAILKMNKRRIYDEILSQNPTYTRQRKKEPLNISILKDPVYIVLLFMVTGLPIAMASFYYLTIFATTEIGISTYEMSIILTYRSLLDFFLKIFFGWLNDKNIYKLTHGLIFCLFVNGVGIMFIPFVSGFWSLVAISTALSLTPAAYQTSLTVILLRQFGKESISSTWGYVRMTQGVFDFLIPCIIGYIIDVTGGYTIPFIIMGTGLIFAGVILLMEPLVIKLSKSEIVIA